MIKKNILLSAIVSILICITSCKKYSEGPVISIQSKTECVVNNWKVGQALNNGKDLTSYYNIYELSLIKNGAATLSAKYNVLDSTFEYVTKGEWLFVNNKEKITFDFNNNDADGDYKILKLQEVEMWLKQDGDSLELHYV